MCHMSFIIDLNLFISRSIGLRISFLSSQYDMQQHMVDKLHCFLLLAAASFPLATVLSDVFMVL